MGTIADSLIEQYRRAWAMLADAIEKCPDEAWQKGTEGLEIGRLAFHIVGAADFYARETMSVSLEPTHCGINPGTIFEIEPGSFPSKPEVQAFMMETEGKWTAFLSDREDSWFASSKGDNFKWTGLTYLDLCLYNLRHMMEHIGHIDVQIRQAQGSSVDWK